MLFEKAVYECQDDVHDVKEYLKNYANVNVPDMRFAIAKALVYSLMQDDCFSTCPENAKKLIPEKIPEDVKGQIPEDIILLKASKAALTSEDVFKF